MRIKADSFMPDRNNIAQAHSKLVDFKSYLKDFYYILANYETYPKNIAFCDIDVNL